MYILHINTGTEKATNLLQYLSADPKRLVKQWPETVGLTEIIDADIDPTDWGWVLDDLQNAKITRLGDNQFRLAMPQMSENTPAAIEQLARTNNRLGHAHLNLAVYETAQERYYPVSGKYQPVPFAHNDNERVAEPAELIA